MRIQNLSFCILTLFIFAGCHPSGPTAATSSASQTAANTGASTNSAAVTHSVQTPNTDPTLDDLFAGTASFQSLDDSQQIVLNITTPVIGVWDQKLPVFLNPIDGLYYALTRGAIANNKFDILLLQSSDGITFTQVGQPIFAALENEWIFFDPHLAIDNSVSPPLYIMTTECLRSSPSQNFGNSACVSTTNTPWVGSSWSQPHMLVQSDGLHSASTGVLLADQGKYYLKWTLLDSIGDGSSIEHTQSTSSWAVQIPNLTSFQGISGFIGRVILGAEQNTHCSSSWECNNVDVQDWKKINNSYYAIYNGANYYGCSRPASEAGDSNIWSLAIRRSTTALGSYDQTSGPLLTAPRKDVCGISYPVVNQIGTATYLYFAYYPDTSHNKMMRSKLVWKQGNAVASVPLPQSPNFLAYPTSIPALITNYYIELLGRRPAASEIDFWQSQIGLGLSAAQIARAFLGLQEFLSRWQNLSEQSKIDALYSAFLYRQPSPAEQGWIVNMLETNQSLDSIANGFLNGNEFSHSTPLVYHLYETLLGREPLPAELAKWQNDILTHSMSSANLINSFLSSLEYQNRIATLTPAQGVETLYQALLYRASDPPGLQSYVQQLAAGASFSSITNSFLGSNEFKQASRVMYSF